MSKKTDASAKADDGPVVVTVPFDGVPDGGVYPKAHAPGDVVEGDLAAVALAEGWAKRATS